MSSKGLVNRDDDRPLIGADGVFLIGLDDLCVRFIINLPREELESPERICFQVEEAQWFYEDFIRPLDPALPSLNLKTFAMRIFQHCPLMSNWSHYHHMLAFSVFLAYKTRVPVRGAIMLNQEMDEVVLVKGWKKGANWSFPRGKINKGEKDLDCAIREVYEETGFDVRAANLIANDDDVKDIEVTMREQHMQLFVFRGVPRDTQFEPRTRKEISKIEWYKLADLPTMRRNKQQDDGTAAANANKFYMVAPFLHPLKKWIAQQKKLDLKAQPATKQVNNVEGYTSLDETGYGNGTPGMSLAELAMPSNLPEVASTQDASDHLKRLLRIDGNPAEMPPPAIVPTQKSAIDASKSEALLALLLQGKGNAQQPTPQALYDNSTPLLHEAQPNRPFADQRLPTGPILPNFSQPQPYRTNVPPGHGFSNVHPDGSAMPSASHFSQVPPVPQYHTPSGHMPAPFQRTGDPEFSQLSEPAMASRNFGPAVPPASKLPLPELTTHSLALLNAFKVKTPKGPAAATLAAPVEGSPHLRKTSQHQDGLLSLLKGPQSKTPPQPIELPGNSVVPSVAPSNKHALSRPQYVRNSPAPYQADSVAGQTSATVSGPLQTPQFESAPKLSHKSNEGSNRKKHANRREKARTPPSSSPMKILPRPQSAKPGASGSVALAPPIPPVQAPQSPEPSNVFQPQILKRSEKTGYQSPMTATARGPSAPQPGLPLQGSVQMLDPQTHTARRPSQTAEQKASLLSLFSTGDAPASPSAVASSPLDSRAVYPQPVRPSGLVSQFPSHHNHSNGDTISRHGTPSDGGTQHPSNQTSSSNKAFLLGFLESVAKGNK